MITLRESLAPEARAIIETPVGEECQVDYGTGPMVRDPVTGKYRRTRLFVLTLGYSRKSDRLLTFRSSSRIWAELVTTPGRALEARTSKEARGFGVARWLRTLAARDCSKVW